MTARAVAINVGANTNAPGFRAPIQPDGRFCFLPIPETEPTDIAVPTYGDLAESLSCDVPARVRDTPVHLDPTFAEYPACQDYTYGDPHGVKARPLLDLSAGDRVYFYATLTVTGAAAWLPPEWGAFLIGHFTLALDPIDPETASTPDELARFASNAHLRRSTMDAAVLLAGDPTTSQLYERAIPLSAPTAGVEPAELVTTYSSDSGRGPWWRRPLRFDASGAAAVRQRVDSARKYQP